MTFQKRLKNQTVINPVNKPNNIRDEIVLQKKEPINKNINEVQTIDEQRVFSKSYETKGKENQKNNSAEFIIKRNDSSRGREGKTSHIYLNKSSNNNVTFFLIKILD